MKTPGTVLNLTFLHLFLCIFCTTGVVRSDTSTCADQSVVVCSNPATLPLICKDTDMRQSCNKSCGLCGSGSLHVSFTDQTVHIKYGAEVRFQCLASGGVGNVTISWKTKTGSLPSNAEVRNDGRTLQILVFEPRDYDDYICVASDGVQTTQHTFHIPPMTSPSTSQATTPSTLQPGATSNIQKHQCLYCDDVLHPNECNLAKQCDDDQSCSKTSGETAGILQAQGVGKRESIKDRYSSQRALPSNPSYCAQCCTSENCNRDLCSGKNVPTVLELVIPPRLLLCQDYDSRECAIRLSRDNNFCTHRAYRYHLCPVTCRSCYRDGFSTAGLPGGSGGTTAPVPGITLPPITISTSKPSGCVDLPQCQKYKDFFCDPSHPEGQKVCPVSCGLCGHTTRHSGTSVIPVKTMCLDPIPRCRCEILDRTLNLCLDGDEDTKRFCCYYCSQKLDKNYTCPNQVCEAAEQVERDKIKKMNLTMSCDDV